jgi:lipid A ethanolaminephosphotransferase
MSPAFKQHKTLAAEAALSQAQHAHETIFHSVMGAFDLRSDIYKPQLDIFRDAARNNTVTKNK